MYKRQPTCHCDALVSQNPNDIACCI